MSLSFGLNVKKSAPAKKPSIWDDPDDEDIQPEGRQQPSRGGRHGLNVPDDAKCSKPNALARAKQHDGLQNASSMRAASAKIAAANEADPAIFDYDSFHDAKSTMNEARKAAARQDAIDRKPKYINKLLDAAARRKQDQQIAQEKLLQREREAEGDEFADKEKFVTGAYKQQQEETRRLQEEEAKKAEIEDERRRRMGGGMQSFYRNVMEQTEQDHQAAVEAGALAEKGNVVRGEDQIVQSDAQIAAEMKAKGVNVHLNEEGQLIDKRELLSAGLNVAPSASGGSGGSDHLKTASRQHQHGASRRDFASERAQGERQRKMIEEQMQASAKRKREEDDAQRAKEEQEAKSKKTGKDVSDAKARYLARKAAREAEEG